MATANIILYWSNTIWSVCILQNVKHLINIQIAVGMVQPTQIETYESSAMVNLIQCRKMQYKMGNILRWMKDESPSRCGRILFRVNCEKTWFGTEITENLTL
jgi:hypothetical protein